MVLFSFFKPFQVSSSVFIFKKNCKASLHEASVTFDRQCKKWEFMLSFCVLGGRREEKKTVLWWFFPRMAAAVSSLQWLVETRRAVVCITGVALSLPSRRRERKNRKEGGERMRRSWWSGLLLWVSYICHTYKRQQRRGFKNFLWLRLCSEQLFTSDCWPFFCFVFFVLYKSHSFGRQIFFQRMEQQKLCTVFFSLPWIQQNLHHIVLKGLIKNTKEVNKKKEEEKEGAYLQTKLRAFIG